MSKSVDDIISESKQGVTYAEKLDREALSQFMASPPGTIVISPDEEIADVYNIIIRTENGIGRGVLSYDDKTDLYSYLDETASAHDANHAVQNELRQFTDVAGVIAAVRGSTVLQGYAPSYTEGWLSVSEQSSAVTPEPSPEQSANYIEGRLSVSEQSANYIEGRLSVSEQSYAVTPESSPEQSANYTAGAVTPEPSPEQSAKWWQKAAVSVLSKLRGNNDKDKSPQQVLDEANKLGENLSKANRPQQLRIIEKAIEKLERDLAKTPAADVPSYNTRVLSEAHQKVQQLKSDCTKVIDAVFPKPANHPSNLPNPPKSVADRQRDSQRALSESRKLAGGATNDPKPKNDKPNW